MVKKSFTKNNQSNRCPPIEQWNIGVCLVIFLFFFTMGINAISSLEDDWFLGFFATVCLVIGIIAITFKLTRYATLRTFLLAGGYAVGATFAFLEQIASKLIL